MTADPVEDSPLAGRAFHLIGVGGAGMSVVAELLAEQGARVTGSDANGGTAFERLADRGLGVVLGHAASNVPEDAVVVVSTAIRDTNPELAAARERGQEVLHRSQALALAAAGRRFVAVAGAHGKTTTSGMLAEALTQVGQDPSFAVGGVVSALGSGAHVGSGEAFVAEADESDASFLSYTPAVEVVTNVEPDHLDRYGTTEAFEQAFVDFAHRLVPGGLLIACSDDPGALRLAVSAARQGLRVVTFGTGTPSDLPDGGLVGEGHTQLTVLERTGGSTRSLLTRWGAGPDGAAVAGASAEVRLAVPGDHVALDAAGAWTAGLELGVDAGAMAAGLGAFGGTGRRFEDRGEAAGVRVVDDYAHHPTEITALLTAARAAVSERGGRVLVLFQPHLFSRTLAFADRFGQALGLADEVVVTAVYPARETQEQFPLVTGRTVSSRVPGGARYVEDRVEAALALADGARSGDLLLTVGAGDVTQMADVVLARLAGRGRS
ncbi:MULTISPECIES: UDP-N-acetylmuramate--L-alanine ligase [unclassified Actinomyces]|uniref:UDP-N-acetylmuramate--L-alanine ligase n=1 Tax=unclassified Actinomyces TaxID=2609248 RepID=UPI002017230B|nr:MULTISPECIES: UDP-N-acetylmuramate--L-alanine ligase [unclassified Actinomyces]MCL3778247.1 UDP-N-acetylmuramate--L-alanine ligase [Actinomyces sp. AC-20-1]MCL3790471.1 UDP-N-acetylmuramate--L-alanine ligase [Actinomyces sp. 187325]MCL3792766.1 UDP-N-acetylmuramate--L-alanine ligase [Actinomyces sp. 186855]MCL3795223.1 UDP-N-acetylmuramate--L-alanine ligase [Actinomyces sp. 217892]